MSEGTLHPRISSILDQIAPFDMFQSVGVIEDLDETEDDSIINIMTLEELGIQEEELA